MIKESWKKAQCDFSSVYVSHFPKAREVGNGLWEFASFEKIEYENTFDVQGLLLLLLWSLFYF